jgi:hypothetical protein
MWTVQIRSLHIKLTLCWKHKVLTTMNLSILVLWVITPCDIIGIDRSLGRACYIFFTAEDESIVYIRNVGNFLCSPSGVTDQEVNIDFALYLLTIKMNNFSFISIKCKTFVQFLAYFP